MTRRARPVAGNTATDTPSVCMRRGRPQSQVAENLRDHRRLCNERDDAHCSGASGTYKRIDFVHLLDEARLAAVSVTSSNASMVEDSSPFSGAFRRFPRLTWLYEP